MVIKNSTPWSTQDIRRLFRRCIREVERVEKPGYPFHKKNRYYQLDVQNRSWGQFRGRASIRGWWMMIGVGMKLSEQGEMSMEDRQQFARVIIHEYYHNLGIRSQDHRNYKSDFTAKWNVDWVKDYPIRKKPVVLKAKADVKLKRYQQALDNLRRADTRLRRAKTLQKKWHDKVRYYEKVYAYKPRSD